MNLFIWTLLGKYCTLYVHFFKGLYLHRKNVGLNNNIFYHQTAISFKFKIWQDATGRNGHSRLVNQPVKWDYWSVKLLIELNNYLNERIFSKTLMLNNKIYVQFIVYIMH